MPRRYPRVGIPISFEALGVDLQRMANKMLVKKVGDSKRVNDIRRTRLKMRIIKLN